MAKPRSAAPTPPSSPAMEVVREWEAVCAILPFASNAEVEAKKIGDRMAAALTAQAGNEAALAEPCRTDQCFYHRIAAAERERDAVTDLLRAAETKLTAQATAIEGLLTSESALRDRLRDTESALVEQNKSVAELRAELDAECKAHEEAIALERAATDAMRAALDAARAALTKAEAVIETARLWAADEIDDNELFAALTPDTPGDVT